ncbi:hypothetical protein U27_04038 [Candidatus Vecturithrix granuli]|uniref:Uncharacterized protein n=1 Tax=Vecturithrix granuli TaxID=1499967 RepID=A0A081BXL9_VECG1|nr:hypothetical protein U27_04038 [Candidatus Vecturithrix granuli]
MCEPEQQQAGQPQHEHRLPPGKHGGIGCIHRRYGGVDRPAPVQTWFPASQTILLPHAAAYREGSNSIMRPGLVGSGAPDSEDAGCVRMINMFIPCEIQLWCHVDRESLAVIACPDIRLNCSRRTGGGQVFSKFWISEVLFSEGESRSDALEHLGTLHRIGKWNESLPVTRWLEHYTGFENGTDTRMKRMQEFSRYREEIRSILYIYCPV